MSLKTLLLPFFAERLLSRERLLARRAREERRRRRRGEPHRLHYFHQVDDPWSALAAGALPLLEERYQLELVPHLVGPPTDEAAPERALLVAHSRRDAELLGRRLGQPFRDPGHQPAEELVERALSLLAEALQRGTFAAEAGPLSRALWSEGATLPAAGPASLAAARAEVARGSALRDEWGHYAGATFFYGGEWYWGLDRLHHLEERLSALGVRRSAAEAPLFPPLCEGKASAPRAAPPAIDFFFSLRSPYSAVATPRLFALARRAGARVRLRPLLPMVMRGLPVPPAKRRYLVLDAAREAFVRGVPFGRVNDPLGRPTERGLALLQFAERRGAGEALVESFMKGVWAEGIDAGSDRGLRRIAERAGLDWGAARAALCDEAWRATVEESRRELRALGLWGVPCFRVGGTVVMGQDRLWAVEEQLFHRP